MKPGARLSVTLIVLWAVALAAAGCNDPRADLPTQTRMDRIRLHTTQFSEREADGPRRIRTSLDHIESEGRWHDEHFARDLRRLGERTDSDVNRWRERQPVYRQDIMDAFDGDLKHANDTIPWMFY